MYYLDTSVVIPLYVKEATSNDCQTFVNTHKGELVISQWTMLEVYSGFSLLKRTGVVQGADMVTLTTTLEQQAKLYFNLQKILVADFVTAKDQLAHNTFGLNLRAGDALHIAIARNNGLELVSSDANMIKAAKAFGVKVMQI
jgi:uncharacterized protein